MTYSESIQRISFENYHTANLAWLVSNNNEVLSELARRELISSLFLGNKQFAKDTIRSVTTEMENIDLVIELEQEIVLVENKIKSSQHSSQLERYSKIGAAMFPGKNLRKFLLSLVGEQPDDDSWSIITYQDLKDVLLRMVNEGTIPKCQIVADYLENLRLLVESWLNFDSDHRSYPRVFSPKVSRKKPEKESGQSTEFHSYVSRNGLETIFQKAFFQKLLKRLALYKFEHTFVSETRGNALLDLKGPLGCSNVIFGGMVCGVGIQIQGNSIKIQFEVPQDSQTREEEFKIQLGKIFSKYMEDVHSLFVQTSHEDWHLNPPKNKDSPYFSVSRKLVQRGESLFDYNIETIHDVLAKAIETSIALVKVISPKISSFAANST